MCREARDGACERYAKKYMVDDGRRGAQSSRAHGSTEGVERVRVPENTCAHLVVQLQENVKQVALMSLLERTHTAQSALLPILRPLLVGYAKRSMVMPVGARLKLPPTVLVSPVATATSFTRAAAIKLPIHLEALFAKRQALQDYVKLVKLATSRIQLIATRKTRALHAGILLVIQPITTKESRIALYVL